MTSLRCALAASVPALVCPFASLAAEGGTGHYLPGGTATLIDLAPTKPGWVTESMYLHYSGDASASKRILIAGTAAADLSADSNALLLGGLYTLEQTPLGAHYSVGAFLPYVWVDVDGKVTTPLGVRRRHDTAAGIGDVTLIPAMLAWKIARWQWNALLPISAPTGDYDIDSLANPGLNYWTFDPTLGGSYSNEQIGLNAALYAGLSHNTENHDTDYQSGSTFHLDGSVQQLLPAGPGYLGIGAEAFYLAQVTGDSGSGAQLGDFEGHSGGIGPVLSYLVPDDEHTFAAELRWLPELDVSNRLEGDYVWLKLVYQFQ